MSNNAVEPATSIRRLSTEFWAIVSVGLVVLGQAAWLDAKIDGGDVRLERKIESLQLGQAAIRERLAALEAISAQAGRRSSANEVGMHTKPAS